ncbi:MAG: 50S ribosomal protein L6 [Chloroflexi bacterium RBG_16_48_8]|nr:MAG: 50S ribosomal protein L6 [Chloroflexi bacterium RBG_16_48_8]
MSRIGRMPIELPKGVKVTIDENVVRVEGPKGNLEHTFRPEISIQLKENLLTIERDTDEPKVRAFHGLTRALINNMVIGVSNGFEKVLQVEGVGYRPEMDGKDLILHVGFSHDVRVRPPEGITFDVDTRARLIKVQGIDKQLVGHVAADIRKIRPPEPYKGKGIRYQGEYIRRKAGKAGKVT